MDFRPLGPLNIRRGFPAFDYVNADAPKGGRLRLARLGQFDTVNTLRYPGRPPNDIRLIYDRLVVASADEIAGYYGLLAKTITVSDDLREVRFTLRPNATWHDGNPVTPADVIFTFETLKARARHFTGRVFES